MLFWALARNLSFPPGSDKRGKRQNNPIHFVQKVKSFYFWPPVFSVELIFRQKLLQNSLKFGHFALNVTSLIGKNTSLSALATILSTHLNRDAGFICFAFMSGPGMKALTKPNLIKPSVLVTLALVGRQQDWPCWFESSWHYGHSNRLWQWGSFATRWQYWSQMKSCWFWFLTRNFFQNKTINLSSGTSTAT